MSTEKLIPLGNTNLNIGCSNTSKTMTNNFSVSEKHSQKNSFWSDQVKPSTTIGQAWKILDSEFGDERKLMDTLLNEITNLRPVKSD